MTRLIEMHQTISTKAKLCVTLGVLVVAGAIFGGVYLARDCEVKKTKKILR